MIILTGASGGIGKEMLSSLSELDDVIAIYNTTKPEIIEGVSNITYHKLDISRQDHIKNFVNEHSHVLNKITLIHGAGVAESSLVVNHTKEMWDTAIEVI